MIGVVADDTTGANDMGTMFNRTGKSVKVLSYSHDMQDLGPAQTDVLIIDTNSRLDRPEVSFAKVHDATRFLQAAGCDLYFKKVASAFVGNIGCEFDGMLAALQETFCLVIPAFPDTGRTTVNGVQYINEVPLAESEFAQDPVNPMTESRIAEIIKVQSQGKVDNLYLSTVRSGTEALRNAIEVKRQAGVKYLVLDAETSNDLKLIGNAVTGYSVFAGSSVMGGYLHYPTTKLTLDMPQFNDDGLGVLTVSGSLMPQTHAQTQYLIKQGMSHIILDSRDMLDEAARTDLQARVLREAQKILSSGADLLIMPTDNPEIVQKTKHLGALMYLDQFAISKLISSFVAELTQRLVANLHLHRFVIAGGDTSGSVCRSLAIQGNYIVREIEPGIPLSLSIDGKFLFVLKSGSFGSPEFLAHAIRQVKGQLE